MEGLIEDTSFSNHKHLLNFASKYFPNKEPLKIDIEELITHLDFVDSRYSVFVDTPNSDIWHVKNELFIYLRERLSDQSGKEYCAKKYKKDKIAPFKFKTAFPMFKYNELLRRLERYRPITESLNLGA